MLHLLPHFGLVVSVPYCHVLRAIGLWAQREEQRSKEPSSTAPASTHTQIHTNYTQVCGSKQSWIGIQCIVINLCVSVLPPLVSRLAIMANFTLER